MKPSIQYRIKMGLIALVVVPMIASLLWKKLIIAADLTTQSGLLILMLVLPFITDAQTHFLKVFGLLFLMDFLWGIWRLGYFDNVTENDVPGIAYLIIPFFLAGLGSVVFELRKFLVRFVNRQR